MCVMPMSDRTATHEDCGDMGYARDEPERVMQSHTHIYTQLEKLRRSARIYTSSRSMQGQRFPTSCSLCCLLRSELAKNKISLVILVVKT